MALKQQIDQDIKEAMKAKDQDALRALRAIKSLILLEETKEGATDGGLTEDAEIKLLNRAAKQRRESAEIYKGQGREDLYATEVAELGIIERYLPKQLTEEELNAKIEDIIRTTGAAGPKDMGKVMGAASKELAGQADGRAISEAVKRILNRSQA